MGGLSIVMLVYQRVTDVAMDGDSNRNPQLFNDQQEHQLNGLVDFRNSLVLFGGGNNSSDSSACNKNV